MPLDAISSYAIMIGLGILPSLIWLVYYYRKDTHPEPKLLVTKTFLMGVILSPAAIIFQLLFVRGISQYYPMFSTHSPTFFLWAAFVEEVVKFLAVREIALYNREFDEPVDAIEYMIAAAMGFAAMENILVLFQVIPDGVPAALSILSLRFVGATLLHALSSALVGYFIAMAWFFRGHTRKLIFVGIIMATLFHFTFNVFLSAFSNQLTSLVYTTILLVIMAFLISILFDKIKGRGGRISELA